MPITESDIQKIMNRKVELYHSSIDVGGCCYLFGPKHNGKSDFSNEAHSGIVALAKHLVLPVPVVVTKLGYIPLSECRDILYLETGPRLLFKEGHYHFRDGITLSDVLD